MPKFNMYDDSEDPFDYLMHFRQEMTLEIHNGSSQCKYFLSSLKGPALSQFHRLSANLVPSFRMLFEIFTTHYLCSVRRKQSVTTIFHVKMEREESIRSFMKRFGEAIIRLDEASMDTIMRAIKKAIFLNTSCLIQYSSILLCQWTNCFKEQTSILYWKMISMQPLIKL